MKRKQVRLKDRRPRKQTSRNKRTLDTSSSSALTTPPNGSHFFCKFCTFSTAAWKSKQNDVEEDGRIFCCHGVRKLPDNYLEPAHFRENELSFYKHHPICPPFVHVLDDGEASRIFLNHLRLNRVPRPENQAKMIEIFKELQNPYDPHPLNINGNFKTTARCKHVNNGRTVCTRDVLIEGISFCFEHTPASIMLKELPLPELRGTLEEKDLTKFIFWMQSQGGTDKKWSTPWKEKTPKERQTILKKSAQRLKISLEHMHLLTGNKNAFNWLVVEN